jgi:sigma-B regulation protein RsbU (phosphoserine phosphatase)
MLRHRILLIIGLGLALLAGALYWTALQRDRLIEQRVADLATRGQRALWQERAGIQARILAELAAQVKSSPPLLTALATGDRDIVANAVEEALADVSAQTDLLEIVDREGRQIFTEAERVEDTRTLDLTTLGEVIRGLSVTGLRQNGPHRFLVLHAFPLALDSGEVVAVTIGQDATPVLADFALTLESPAFLINPRGRMVTGTEPALWTTVAPDLPLRRPSFALVENDGRRYTLVSVPVADLGGGQAALVVTLRDATGPLDELVRQRALTLIGAGLGIAALLLGMHLYLRRAFRPLDRAIDVLGALSRGDTTVRMDPGGQAEIGRIATAVAGFRSDLIALADLRLQGERRTRRQERLIRARMLGLADALDGAAREEIVGILEQAPGATPESPPDLALLTNVLALVSRRVTEAIETRARLAGITQELAIARELQASLVPTAFPPVPGFAVDAGMIPAREVGGDFYDFFETAPGRFVLIVGDVSGKGVPAALFMAIARTLVRAATRSEPDPARCIGIVNEVLAEDNEQMMFVTLFYAVLDVAEHRLTYVNAGHNAPLMVGPGGSTRTLPVTGDMAVAVMDGLRFRSRTVDIAPGETLLVFSDGLTEAFDPDDVAFGEDRLRALAGALDDGRPLTAFTHGLLDGVTAFVRGAQQSDDITFLALRRDPLTPAGR